MDDSATYDEMPTEVLRLVNERCDRYEADRQAGRVHPIDAYLGDLDADARTVVGAELAALRDAYDRSATEVPAVIGGYDLIRCLGRGGMGAVYLARDPRLGRHVAVKVLRPALAADPAARVRFRREALAAGRLDHPNVVPALDAGEEDGCPYLVSAYVEGDDLASLVRRLGPVEPHRAAGYVVQAARGLAHAHDRGIVHRDVKPANLILGTDGVVRVLDLGLARMRDPADPDRTATGLFLGTAAYAAPEQIVAPVTVDARSDVYGLGGVLHYLVTGRAPRPWEDFRALPGGTSRVVRRMLAADPNERPASMAEVIQLLEAPPRPTRRLALAAGAVTVLGASAGTIAYVKPWRREDPPPRFEPVTDLSAEQLALADRLGLPAERTDEYGISFVLIPNGQAWAGTPADEIDRLVAAEPDPKYHPYIRSEARRVIKMDRPYYLARTELTVGQMRAIVGPRPRFITQVQAGDVKGYAMRDGAWVREPGRSWNDLGPECPLTDDHPAVNLTWTDVIRLAEFLRLPGKGAPGYFVPTEDEWEYGCRAGEAADVAVYDVPRPRSVRTRAANAWGLFDMLGNVLEWCRFTSARAEDPNTAPLRGGKFNDSADRVRPAARVIEPKDSPLGGVRLAMRALDGPAGRERVLGK